MIVLKVTLEIFEIPLSAWVLSARARARARARPRRAGGLGPYPQESTTLKPLWARANFWGAAPTEFNSFTEIERKLNYCAPKIMILKLDI